MAEITVVIRGGSVVTPEGLRRLDVALGGSTVVGLAETIEPPTGATVLDARGCLIGPGLVDLHTHLRQPGREEAETVESGARAAALGGYTAVVAMPNTEPAIDSAGVARDVLALGRTALAEVAVSGAITVGRAGKALAPMGELAALGVRIFTDDGAGVQDGALMRRALDYAKGLGVTLAQHCEDECLAGGRRHARGVLVQPAGAARAFRRRPRSRWSRVTSSWCGSPAPRCTSCTSPRPDRWSSSGRPRPRGCRSRPRRRRITCC